MNSGASRIQDHLLGRASCKRCTLAFELALSTSEFEAKLQKVQEATEFLSNKKARKETMAQVNAASMGITPVSAGSKQTKLHLQPASSGEADAAISEFFFGCNVPAIVAEHRLVKKMVCTLKSAPPTYDPPSRRQLYGKLLDDTKKRIQD